MPKHQFVVGQSVRVKRRYGMSRPNDELYRITGTLPEIGNSPQYRVRSAEERHERVITEDELEGAETTSVQATFSATTRSLGAK